MKRLMIISSLRITYCTEDADENQSLDGLRLLFRDCVEVRGIHENLRRL